jgi:hypothetical protein
MIINHVLATRPWVVRALTIYAGRPAGVTHDLMWTGPNASWRATRVQAPGRGAWPNAPRRASGASRRITPVWHVHAVSREQTNLNILTIRRAHSATLSYIIIILNSRTCGRAVEGWNSFSAYLAVSMMKTSSVRLWSCTRLRKFDLCGKEYKNTRCVKKLVTTIIQMSER